MTSLLRAVLFDLDGTLTDSGPLIRRMISDVMRARAGLDLLESAYSRFVGPPLEDTFCELGVPESEIEDYIDDYRTRYFARMDTTKLFDGILPMLERIQAQGLHTAIATSKGEKSAKQVCDMTGLTQFVDVVCGSDPEAGRTHKHHVVDHALRSLEERAMLDPNQRQEPMALGTQWSTRSLRFDVVMVGDRSFDTQGAAVHGIRTILVDWGEGTAEEKANAWKHVSSPDELANLLTRQ
ncbi:HAD hydrolase-like protein [Arcanobacterium buesumense]|uniref:HAD hydrolase-like protein n=1 Tax=Arcanobacterium buesumense TaxID=2722751 RepID=A0A6H2EKE2_9ACTO|nr:HAD hydrolase-like protein [Arcanobacterium buesumense]QJC21644.1 HAD hydrolase-like protein [Arcanobacterium buesumense]